MFSQNDKQQLAERGVTLEVAEQQISCFEKGFPFLPVERPATIGDGILSPSEDTILDYARLYEIKSVNLKLLKFVPASGAASRMFQKLWSLISESDKGSDYEIAAMLFNDSITKFPFYNSLRDVMQKRGVDLDLPLSRVDLLRVIEMVLNENGLNLSKLPKGLLPFHNYGSEIRTPFQEHLVEGAMYCRSIDGAVKIHLTVSPEHMELFKKLYDELQEKIEQKYKIKLDVQFSVQNFSTDTIAVDLQNRPFRKTDGKIFFRPGGHGALIDNLNKLNSDLVFIKNIDNVVPDSLKIEDVKYKKALGGILISYRERIFDFLELLLNKEKYYDGLVDEVLIFMSDELFIVSPPGIGSWSSNKKLNYIVSKLNRPLRICGMVRNTGEPGGGPFWVRNKDNSLSLQIVESSQINLENPLNKKLFAASTHFNPVDIVCSFTDYTGKKFNLKQYIDHDTGFISEKTIEGKKLKALELPGLWNGAMSDWNTIFAEVPLSTFNPVKTVYDLLRPSHTVTTGD